MHRVSWEQRREASNPELAAKNEAAQARFPVRLESLEQDLILTSLEPSTMLNM